MSFESTESVEPQHLARSRGEAVGSSSAVTQGTIRFGEDFEFDPRALELRNDGRALKLERIPVQVLLILVEQKGQLVTREEIAEKIWGKGAFLDTDNSINGAIRKIRQVSKGDPQGPRYVQTLSGRGYRFIAPVFGQELETPAPAHQEASGPRTLHKERRLRSELLRKGQGRRKTWRRLSRLEIGGDLDGWPPFLVVAQSAFQPGLGG